MLARALGTRVEPVFTPPWNRCTAVTADVLADLGFAVLSRDSTATPLPEPRVREVPITVDWFGSRKGLRWTPYELADRMATAVRIGAPVGIMLHHAVTDDGEFAALSALLALLTTHPSTRAISLTALAVVPS